MKKQRNINKALSKYLENLDIGDNNRTTLKSARTSIRVHLRENFPVAKGKIKFVTQGSFRYQTINLPCNPPTQQMDLDDGIYVPMSYAEKIQSEDMLGYLAKSLSSHGSIKNQEWKLSTEKPSCVRIVIAQDKHIDIPLYRAPDEEIGIKSLTDSSKDPLYEIFGEGYFYTRIKKNCVELAHKDSGWIRSDPSEILDWFVGNFKKYGMKYVYICRILKAWRDNQWPQDKSPLSSILLMRMVEMIFEDENTGILQNLGDIDNDMLLYAVSKKLTSTIRGTVTDPDPTRHEKLNDFSEGELQLCVERFDQLNNTLYSVLYEQSVSNFLDKLCKEFGRFFPQDSGLCKILAVAPLITPVAAANPTPRFYGG